MEMRANNERRKRERERERDWEWEWEWEERSRWSGWCKWCRGLAAQHAPGPWRPRPWEIGRLLDAPGGLAGALRCPTAQGLALAVHWSGPARLQSNAGVLLFLRLLQAMLELVLDSARQPSRFV